MITHLPPATGERYVELVRRLTRSVEPRLGVHVVANRVLPTAVGLTLESWTVARARLRRAVRAADPKRRALIARSDVRDCYAAIAPQPLGAGLAALGADRSAIGELMVMLDRFHDRGVPGLPVGPDASAVLANVALASADRAISATGSVHVRWVDDIVLFAGSRREASRGLDAWRRALARSGLEENASKTTLDGAPAWLERFAGSTWAGPLPVG